MKMFNLGKCGNYDRGGHFDRGLCCIDGEVCHNNCGLHKAREIRQFKKAGYSRYTHKGFDIGGQGIGGSGRGPGR